MVEEAHKQGRKVAAHAYTPVSDALNAGVDAIEHGNNADRATLELMIRASLLVEAASAKV